MHVCNYVQLIDWAFPPKIEMQNSSQLQVHQVRIHLYSDLLDSVLVLVNKCTKGDKGIAIFMHSIAVIN